MGASDSSPPPASASLEEEPSEAAEGRITRQEPLDLSQVRDAACGPIYFEGKRPVAIFIGVLFILIGAPAVRILWGSWRHEWITFFVALAWVLSFGRLISMWRPVLNRFSLTVTESGIIDCSSYGFKRYIPWSVIRGFAAGQQFVHLAVDRQSPEYRSLPWTVRASLFNRKVIVAKHLNYPSPFLAMILSREKDFSLFRQL